MRGRDELSLGECPPNGHSGEMPLLNFWHFLSTCAFFFEPPWKQ